MVCGWRADQMYALKNLMSTKAEWNDSGLVRPKPYATRDVLNDVAHEELAIGEVVGHLVIVDPNLHREEAFRAKVLNSLFHSKHKRITSIRSECTESHP